MKIIMDYEKAYKEALERAKDLHDNHALCEPPVWKTCEQIFTELRESEDEKIRKAIGYAIGQSTHSDGTLINGVFSEEAFAWLEKQKPANKVEPKFKWGDWVIDKQGIVHQIANVVENVTNHIYGYDTVDGEYFNDYVEGVRLWTIQDAKDGDVLYSLDSKQPFLYKERPQFSQARGYCCINKFGEFAVWNTSKCIICTEECIPATKEQCDLLFQKMKEEGYEWDADKKELKKIEQPSTDWSEEDEKCREALINICLRSHDEMDGRPWSKYVNWLKSLKPQPRQRWSEEDSKRLLRIHQFIWANRKGDTDEIYQQEQDADWIMTLKPQPEQEWSEEDEANMDAVWKACGIVYGTVSQKRLGDWLKSLKLQPHWKPSKEQMEALRFAKNDYVLGDIKSNLEQLYEDLKKL